MNIVVLRGRLSSDPVARPLASGSVLVSLELTTDVDGAAVSVPVAWFDPPGDPDWVAGDELVVAGTVRRRFFRSAGTTQSRTEVVAEQVIAASARRQVATMLRRVSGRLQGT